MSAAGGTLTRRAHLEAMRRASSVGGRTAVMAVEPAHASFAGPSYATPAFTASPADGARFGAPHPLGDPATSAALERRADEITAAFSAIETLLRELAPRQFDADFAERAADACTARLGFTPPAKLFRASWTQPLDVRALYAHCVLLTFTSLMKRGFARDLSDRIEGEIGAAPDIMRRFGFHAIDMTPCADGRLSGLVDYILRVPPAVVSSRRSFAGGRFEVEEALQRWEAIELGRWSRGIPNDAGAPTRYLKLAVYHYSGMEPATEGCAAYGHDPVRAATSLIARLERLQHAVRAVHGSEAVATLLVGVNTDTDAIRVHVPDSSGALAVSRVVDNADLYERTAGMARDAAKDAIREAVAQAMGVAPDDAATEGMRWLCGFLLKNNIAQIDAVRQRYGGGYTDRGHTERLIIVGDAVDDVTLRNLAFQAQMETVEEGAGDLDIGMRIIGGIHDRAGLAVPVLIHTTYDARIPGAFERAQRRACRLRDGLLARYAARFADGTLHAEALVRSTDGRRRHAFDDDAPCTNAEQDA